VSYSLGIDIGTTFVAAAIARTGAAAQMIPLGDHAVVTPPVVGLRSDGTVATGETAQNCPDGVGRELMNRLGDPTPVVVGGAPYEVTAVLGALLRDVVAKVTTAQGEPPDHIVLTRPASWGAFRCALFEDAARQAELTKPAVVTEPEAAVAHYAATQGWQDGDTIAVCDLDGGTFDATVVRKQSDKSEILGHPERLEHLGGDGGPELIESTITALSDTLKSAQVEPAELRAVLLVGGSAEIPSAAEMVSAQLGSPVVVDSHPEHVVALGAATLAAASAPAVPRSPALQDPEAASRPEPATTRPEPAATQPEPTPALPAPAPTQTKPTATQPEAALPIPAQRTMTAPATVRTAVPILASTPAAKPAATPSPRPARPDDGRRASTASTPSTLPTVSIPPTTPSVASGPSTSRRHPRVLIGAGAAVAMAGLITLVVLGVMMSAGTAPPHSAAPPKAQPSAVAKVGPQPASPVTPNTIPMSASPRFVAVSPDGRHAYTANRDAQSITVVDTATNQVTATIPVAAGPPRFLSFAPDGRKLYVSIFNDRGTIHSLGVLDTRSNTMVATIPQPARPFPADASPDGTQLYVPLPDIASISVIDTTTNDTIGQIPVAPNPVGVAFSADGQRAFTVSHDSNLVSVIETRNLEVESTIPVGNSPASIALNPHRPLAAVVNDNSNSVSLIDTAGQQVRATIPVGKDPQDIAWSPDGRFGYVVNEGSNSVSVIDSETNQVTATMPTGAGPTSIALLPGGRGAYVSNAGGGSLTILQFGA
jgi:YVTN family beta-propeller protein